MITEFKFQTLTQTLVGDCSFVSSLAVCASWEQRFEKTLISRNIYPQVICGPYTSLLNPEP